MKKFIKRSLKGWERAIKRKDLEVAKSLEIQDKQEENLTLSNPKQSTPKARSDLPKQ